MTPRNTSPHDHHRPCYHFTAAQHWINDPNGLIHWQGEYHLFYQYNPHAAYWGAMHWGHAVSRDLVHWDDLPIALAPDQPYDRDGVFSGCAIVHNGRPVIVYTGVNNPHQLPCLAYADDSMRTFTKATENPVIRTLPDNLVHDFRDHTMWHDGEFWYQALGSGDGTRAVAPLFRSHDLLTWEYMGRLIQSEDTINEQLYECPDFFASNNQHAFITSPLPMRRVIVMGGTFDGRVFRPTTRDYVDHGQSFYAPQSFSDAQGRRIMIGWCQEQRHESASRAAGWQGVMTLPRILALDDSGHMTYQVAPEVALLEKGTITHGRQLTTAQAALALAHVAGDALVIHTTIRAQEDAVVTLTLRHDPLSGEATTVTWERAQNRLIMSMAHSSLNQNTSAERYVAPLHPSVNDTLELHIYVDRSIIEVYAGIYTVCTLRVYPTHRADRYTLHTHGEVHFDELIVREMSLSK
ncbi:MAG: glycoside hydrolase family 32 protein [Roseiflexaceae bacterium]|jgi:beta-fructofuranosidase